MQIHITNLRQRTLVFHLWKFKNFVLLIFHQITSQREGIAVVHHARNIFQIFFFMFPLVKPRAVVSDQLNFTECYVVLPSVYGAAYFSMALFYSLNFTYLLHWILIHVYLKGTLMQIWKSPYMFVFI